MTLSSSLVYSEKRSLTSSGRPSIGAEAINREEGQRRAVVMSNVRDRDLGSFVAEVRSKLSGELRLPPGYFVEFGGQFENQERATQRLMLVIPVVVGLIFGLLYAMFGSVAQSVLVMMNVPFAFVGGIAALWLRQMNLNLSASVGFIALFGVAVLNGIVLLNSVNQLYGSGLTVHEAVINVQRAIFRFGQFVLEKTTAKYGKRPVNANKVCSSGSIGFSPEECSFMVMSFLHGCAFG